MDRLIWAAWRAFWIGLGASLVVIAQSLLAPSIEARVEPAPAAPAIEQPAPAVNAPARRVKSGAPILSRNPFESRSVHHAS